MPIDFFVWIIRNENRTFVVDTGFVAPISARCAWRWGHALPLFIIEWRSLVRSKLDNHFGTDFSGYSVENRAGAAALAGLKSAGRLERMIECNQALVNSKESGLCEGGRSGIAR